jgi:hypothetical protein
MGKNKLQKTLNELTLEGKLIKDSKPSVGGGGLETLYMLPRQRYLVQVDAGRIIGATEHLKALLLRMPTVDEIAVEAGIPPQEATDLVYKLVDQTDWYNPTLKLIEEARVRLGEALVCAARIRDKHVAEDGTSEVFNYEKDAVIVEEANRFLKEHTLLLPKLSSDGEAVTKWPSEALQFLGENYVPIERPCPFFAAIDRGTGRRIF